MPQHASGNINDAFKFTYLSYLACLNRVVKRITSCSSTHGLTMKVTLMGLCCKLTPALSMPDITEIANSLQFENVTLTLVQIGMSSKKSTRLTEKTKQKCSEITCMAEVVDILHKMCHEKLNFLDKRKSLKKKTETKNHFGIHDAH